MASHMVLASWFVTSWCVAVYLMVQWWIVLHRRPTASRFAPSTAMTIPHRMVFTYGTRSDLPDVLQRNMNRTISMYRASWGGEGVVRFLDDEECVDVLRRVEPRLVRFYRREKKGKYRGDVCRLAVLYEEGGYYFDVDIKVVRPVVLEKHVSFASVLEGAEPPVRSLFQAFIAASKGHLVVRRALDNLLSYYEHPFLINGHLGPRTLYDAVTSVPRTKAIKLFREAELSKVKYLMHFPRQNGTGCCCDFVVLDENDAKVYFYSRVVGAGEYCQSL